MMNKDFWGFLSYSDKLFVALIAIMLSGFFLIYQEDLERETSNTLERVFDSLGHQLKWVV